MCIVCLLQNHIPVCVSIISPFCDPYDQISRASASTVLPKLQTIALQCFIVTSAFLAKSPGMAACYQAPLGLRSKRRSAISSLRRGDVEATTSTKKIPMSRVRMACERLSYVGGRSGRGVTEDVLPRGRARVAGMRLDGILGKVCSSPSHSLDLSWGQIPHGAERG